MPVSSFSNRSFAYRRGDKEKRIVSRVGPYPINKPSTTTSNGVEYTKYISGMYAFGHTPGAPNYGNLSGGVNGTYNHGWFNGQSSEQNVAHFQQIFDEATSHTQPQIDGQYGYKTVSFHGPNNKLYGWIEHNQRWSNDPNDAQTSVGSGNIGGGNTVFQVNGPGSGVAYTYYFDPNAIDGTNTDSPAMDDIIDLRFWSGSYPTGETNNFQVGVNGLLLQRYVQRNAGFSSITYWRDKNTSTAPTLGFGAQILFSNSTDAGIFRNLLSGVVQLPTTSGAYSQYNGHKPIRFHFKDGTTEDFGPDDGSSTQRVWNTGNSSSTVDVYTTAADNGSRTMSLTGSAGTSGINSGSIYFSSLNAWNGTNARVITADSNDFNLPDGTDVTVEFWYKIPVTPPTQGNGYLFDLGDGNYGWLAAYAWNQNGTHTLRVGTYYGAIWLPPVGSEVGMTLNQWYHLAITRESGVWKVYLDGVFQGSKASSALGSFDTWPDRISLGGYHNMSYPNYGVVSYISDFRFVKGRAVYTGNFTPPSGPLTTTGGTYPSMTNITNPTSAQTLLLTQISSGSIVDNSQYTRSLTTYNTVSIEGGAGSAPIDWSNKEIIGISYATISGHGGHDDPYLIGQNVASHLFHNNVNGQTQIFGQYTDP